MANKPGGLLSPPQWYVGGQPGVRPPYDPLAAAAQAQAMAQQQMMSPGPAGSSYSTITRGNPMDFDALRMQMMGWGSQGAQQPGRPDPTPGRKPPPGGGGQQPGPGAGDQRFNMFSWQPFENLKGVREGDLGSIMRYYAQQAAQQPKPLNMGKFFGQGSQPGQQRKGFGEV